MGAENASTSFREEPLSMYKWAVPVVAEQTTLTEHCLTNSKQGVRHLQKKNIYDEGPSVVHHS